MEFIKNIIPEQIRHDRNCQKFGRNKDYTLYMCINMAIAMTQRTIKAGYKGRLGSLQREIIQNGGALIATPQEIENWLANKQKRTAKIMKEPDANKKFIYAVEKTSIIPVRSFI